MAKVDEFYGTDIAHKTDFVLTPKGGLDTVSGIENVKQALLRRLITSKGSVIHRPLYGVGIKDFQNTLFTKPTQRRLLLEIREQFELDPRVEKVTGMSITREDLEPSKVLINVRVKLVGYDERVIGFSPFEDA